MSKVIITHGDIKESYEIIGPKCFHVKVSKKSFDEAIVCLENECINAGGNAIIYLTQPEIEKWCTGGYYFTFYGTVVKIKE